jgi:aminopeptidase N
MEEAFSLDSLPTSHPLEIPVKDTWEIDQIFDGISYFKGASLVRMMSDYLGPQVFLEGISSYLKDKSYSNSTSAALFDDLSKISGVDVASFMEPWIRKAGFPVVEVSEEDERIMVKQYPFIGYNQSKTGEDVTRWCIPLALQDIIGGTEKELLTTNQLVKAKSPNREGGLLHLTQNQSLYCYIKYAPDIGNNFYSTASKISAEDKVALIRDLRALTTAGAYLVGDLLTFLLRLKDHDDFFVINEKLKCIDGLGSIFSDHSLISQGLETYKRELFSESKLGVNWATKHNDDYLTIEKNRLQLEALLALNHEETISEVENRFASWMSGARDTVPQSLQSVILGRGVARGGEAAYKAVKEEYVASGSVDGKEICLAALGRAKESALVADLLDFACTEEMPLQNAHLIALALGGNENSKHILWNYVKTNWGHVYERLSRNPIVLNWWIEMGLSNFSDLETEQEISSFFKGKDIRIFQRTLVVVTESIKRTAEFKLRSEQEITEWLVKHDFATVER